MSSSAIVYNSSIMMDTSPEVYARAAAGDHVLFVILDVVDESISAGIMSSSWS